MGWALVGFGWPEQFTVMLIPESNIPDALRFDFIVLARDSGFLPDVPVNVQTNPRRVVDDD